MKKTLLLMLSLLSIASASQSGAEIFKKCGICHGDNGQKHSLNITKSIAGLDEKHLEKILKEYKAKTRNTYGLGTMMQGQASKLTDADIKAVSAHISSLPVVKIKDVEKKISKSIVDGAQIFKKCSICHGDKGHKRSLNVSKYIAGMDKGYIYKTLKAYQSGKLSSYGYGSMMQGQATKLSDKEMKAVSAYVSVLPVVESTDSKKLKKEVTKITKQEVDRNTFIKDFFAKSKNPNETLKAAEEAYKIYLNKLKENNE